jgi:hypothetical protein
MSDDKPRDTPAPHAGDETQPVRAEGAAPAPSAPAAGEPAPAEPAPPVEPVAQRRGFRERLRSVGRPGGSRTFGLAALIASALAGIIVGGLGFATVHAITDDRDRGRDHDRGAWVERRDGEGPGPGGMRGGPRGVPAQLPPTTAPEDDEGSTS